ncbi:unnamed protein product [Closterium sp. NIES-65]|nr:unnamed protein product [Closterium sp. NIES-65]
MATSSVLAFDAEDRAIDFDVWVDDLQLFLQCDRADGLSLFDLTSGASPAPAADADATVRSHWATRNAAARLVVRRHLPTSKLTRLPDSLRVVRDHFLSVCPTTLTVDLLEKALLAAEKSIVAVGASRGDPRTPVFDGCSPSPLLPSVASAAAADLVGFESVDAASAPGERRRSGKGKGGKGARGAGGGGGGGARGSGGGGGGGWSGGGGGGVGGGSGGGGGGGGGKGGGGDGGGSGGGGGGEGGGGGGGAGWGGATQRVGSGGGEQCGGAHPTQRCFGRLTDAWRHQFPEATEIPRWGELSRAGVAIFDLDFDAILAAMYAKTISEEGDCYRCFPPDLGIETAALGTGEAAALVGSEAVALGASASASSGAGESALSGTTPASASHTFTFDSEASRSFFRDCTTLSPLGWPVAVSLADPSGGPVLAHFSTVLPCPAAPSGTLSGLYLPSFSMNLVSGADLQDAGVHQFTPARQRVTHCTDARTSRHLATFTRRAPACVPCVEGRQRAAPHSSQFPPTEAPLQTLHMDLWGPACVRGQGHERYFLLVVDDYSRYTTVFPLRSKGDITEVLIDLIRAARLQLRQSFGSDFPVLRLHSNRGGEFSSGLLRAYCRARGIRQTFTLPDSPQQNGIAERPIGMVMDVAHTSMMHAAAPHFLWPFAVRYAAHQINLQPRVSRPETSPALLWMGKVGDASAFRIRESRAFVCDLSADKLSPRAAPCVFLGFPPDAPGWQLYNPTSRRVLSSQDVTFDGSVPYCRLFPYRTPSLPPPPLFLVPDAIEPVEVTGDSGAAERAELEGVDSGGAERVSATPGGAEPEGATTGGAEPGGAGRGGATTGGAEPGGAELGVLRLGVLSLGVRSLRELGLLVSRLAVLSLQVLRVLRLGGSHSLHWSCVSGFPGAGGVLLELEVLRLLRVQVLRVPKVLVLGVLELLGPRVRLELELLRVLALRLLLSVLEAVLLGVLLVLLEVLELEVLLALVLPLGLQPASPLPAPSPYTCPIGGLAERREPASRPAWPVRTARTSGSGSRQRPPPVPGTHRMSLRPSTAPLRAPLPSPPESSLPALADPESDTLRGASPSVTRLLASVVTDPSFESTAASALVAELVDFAARCRLDYAASLVAESESVCPPSVRGECALGTDVLEERQEEF